MRRGQEEARKRPGRDQEEARKRPGRGQPPGGGGPREVPAKTPGFRVYLLYHYRG